MQMERNKNGKIKINRPFTLAQLGNIRSFLSPEPDGMGYFRNFVLINRNSDSYTTLNWIAKEQDRSTSEHLFDIYKLFFYILGSLCGYDKVGIFGVANSIGEPINPDDIILTNSLFVAMTSQLIAVVKEIEPDIPVIFFAPSYMGKCPKILND
ncbi:MAG: hypothetical protein J7L53_02465 [Deltaproteobacteria bacterium]|nr:hypothetical protein [Deltaproteobacteria bacterium]